jgi:hypothetical protein
MTRQSFRFKNNTFALQKPLMLSKRDPLPLVSGNTSASVVRSDGHDIYRPDMSIHERKHQTGIQYREVGKPRLKRRKGSVPTRLTYRPKISVPAVRFRSRATKPRKKRLSWGSSASSDVAGYRLYWAVGRGVDYGAEHADIGKVTTILLPDDIASFPHVAGRVEFGVTALSQHGNESDMMIIADDLDFRAPEPPKNLRLEET